VPEPKKVASQKGKSASPANGTIVFEARSNLTHLEWQSGKVEVDDGDWLYLKWDVPNVVGYLSVFVDYHNIGITGIKTNLPGTNGEAMSIRMNPEEDAIKSEFLVLRESSMQVHRTLYLVDSRKGVISSIDVLVHCDKNLCYY
jgi:hypothetical protein